MFSGSKSTRILGVLLVSVVLALLICEIEARRGITDEDDPIINPYHTERPHVLDKRQADSGTTEHPSKKVKRRTRRPSKVSTQKSADGSTTKGPKPTHKPKTSTTAPENVTSTSTTSIPETTTTTTEKPASSTSQTPNVSTSKPNGSTSKPNGSTTKPPNGSTSKPNGSTTTGKPNNGTSTTTGKPNDDDLTTRQAEETLAIGFMIAGLKSWKRALEKNGRVLDRLKAGEFFHHLTTLQKTVSKWDAKQMMREYVASIVHPKRRPRKGFSGDEYGDDDDYLNNDDNFDQGDY